MAVCNNNDDTEYFTDNKNGYEEDDDLKEWVKIDISVDGTLNEKGLKRQVDLNSSLLTAVLRDDIKDVIKFMNAGASVNATCRLTQSSALLIAVACGHRKIAELLISSQANVESRNIKGCQAAHLAAATGNLKLLHKLMALDNGSIYSQVDPNLFTPLGENDLDSCGEDLESACHRIAKVPYIRPGATPLHAASQSIHVNCVLAILNHGGTQGEDLMKIRDKEGLTALDVVGESESISCKNILSRLPSSSDYSSMKGLSKGVQVPEDLYVCDIEEAKGGNQGNFTEPESKALKVVKALLSAGAEVPKCQTKMRTTCLHWAVEHQDIQLLELLLQHGSCLHIQNALGDTPMHLAATRKLFSPLRTMLQDDSATLVCDSVISLNI